MFSTIFIERPRLAMVIAIVITLAGGIALTQLPVAELPSISPPVVTISAVYPGASAQVIKDTIAAPIEQEMNGVENMLYMNSDSTNNGTYSLQITFDVDSDPDINQVNVQNRLQLAESQLPSEVVNQGISVRRRSSDMLGVVSFISPDETRDRQFLSNYITRTIKDNLQRIEGVSDVFVFGEYQYSMRIWMDPDKLVALDMSADEVVRAIRQQNIQATLGSVGTAPNVDGQQLQYSLNAKGRLDSLEEFNDIVIRTNNRSGLVRVKDVADVELGSKSYNNAGSLDNQEAISVALYRSSDANAVATMNQVRAVLADHEKTMPADMAYIIPYDTSEYVQTAIKEISFTLGMTFSLVILVIFVFLQNARATLVPAAAIPVSIIGTFAVLLALGLNINTITLFALVLAIALVVDDAIVVVENVHRIMEEEDLDSKEATIKTMTQVTGPIISTTLVLLAIFVPIIFMPGITGQLYKQFGVTLCVSVLISSLCALTLSPAMCGVLLTKGRPQRRGPLAWFNKFLYSSRNSYTKIVGWLIRKAVIGVLLFLMVVGGAWFLYGTIPTSFLPQEDKGGFLIDVQLPEGATLQRLSEVNSEATQRLLQIKGVQRVIAVDGFSFLSGQAENVGFIIADLAPWDERTHPNLHIDALVQKTVEELNQISTASIRAFVPPAIQGLGVTGGFDFRLQALEDQPPNELAAVGLGLVMAANQHPALNMVYTTYSANTPQLWLDLERTRMQELGVSTANLFSTINQHLGSQYVNDFNLYGRTYQVKMRAKDTFRKDPEDILDLYVTSDSGMQIPVENLANISTILGAKVINRYNQFTSLNINGQAAPGYSSGQAMEVMEELAREHLPPGYSFEWSTMSLQEQDASGTVGYLFALALIFAYLFLVAQYESWNLPLTIILSVIVATLGALIGLWITGISMSIYAQIGMVLLVGLAAKNAILIVEFSRDLKEDGATTLDAAIDGARIRFRAVLMTAFTFILGVAPLVWAVGAGASSRRHIGTVVFSGMIAASTIALLLIPLLYFLLQSMRDKSTVWKQRRRKRLEDKTLTD